MAVVCAIRKRCVNPGHGMHTFQGSLVQAAGKSSRYDGFEASLLFIPFGVAIDQPHAVRCRPAAGSVLCRLLTVVFICATFLLSRRA